MLLSVSLWASIGNVMAVKGKAVVGRSSERLKAISGMELIEGDKIVTQAKSRVQVMLKDETIVTVGASSSFGFEEFLYDGTPKSKLSMSATRGFFRAVTGRLGKVAPERFKVKTPSATIGIRGTDFSGDVRVDYELFKCYKGKIYILHKGVSRDVDAGYMMKIGLEKVEVREFRKYSKGYKKIRTYEDAQAAPPTQDVADITQLADEIHELDDPSDLVDLFDPIDPIDPVDLVDPIDPIDPVDPVDPDPTEPFTMTPGSEDRPTRY